MSAVSTYKVVVVGASGVGKTAIVQRLTDGTFADEQQPTIGVEFKCFPTNVGNDIVKLNIWDTAGQEKFRSVSKAYFRNAVGAVLVFALDDMKSFDDLNGWLSDIHTLCVPNARILVVGNKTDLVDTRCISQSEAQDFAERHKIDYIETSALDGSNIDETFHRLARYIHEKVQSQEIRGTFQTPTPSLLIPPKRDEPEQPANNAGCC